MDKLYKPYQTRHESAAGEIYQKNKFDHLQIIYHRSLSDKELDVLCINGGRYL